MERVPDDLYTLSHSGVGRSIPYYLLLTLFSTSITFPFSVKSLSASSNIEAAVLGVDTSGMVGDQVKVYILVKPYYAVVDRLTTKLSRVEDERICLELPVPSTDGGHSWGNADPLTV